MFTALFLAPWMVLYALSTLVMTHQEYINSFYSSKSPVMVKERELDYSRSFPTNLTRRGCFSTAPETRAEIPATPLFSTFSTHQITSETRRMFQEP